MDAAADVEKGLVQRQRLDQRRVTLEDRPDLTRNLRVTFHARGQEDALGDTAAGP